jgi:hypothetical protein
MHLTRMQYCQQVKYGLKACLMCFQSHKEMGFTFKRSLIVMHDDTPNVPPPMSTIPVAKHLSRKNC